MPRDSPTGTVAAAPGGAALLAVDDDRLYVLDCDADRQSARLGLEMVSSIAAVPPELADVVTGLFATEGSVRGGGARSVFLVAERKRPLADRSGRRQGLGPAADPAGLAELRSARSGRPLHGDLAAWPRSPSSPARLADQAFTWIDRST